MMRLRFGLGVYLYNQGDSTYTMFFIIISALHVSGGFSAHHQELIKLYVQPWVLSSHTVWYRQLFSHASFFWKIITMYQR